MAWSRPEWNQPMGSGTSTTPPRRRSVTWIVAGVVVAVLAALLVVLTSSATRREVVLQEKMPVVKKTVKRLAKGKVAPISIRKEKPTPTEKASAQETKKSEYVKKPGQLQLPNGKILTFPPPAEGQTRKVYAYGHTYECDHLGNFRDISKRQLFKTAFEANLLALANEDKPFIPAFLMGLDQEDVAKMLAKNYEPLGDETEEEKAQIKAYDEMRAAALEYMGQGGKFDDFVDNIAIFVKKERQARASCLREVMTLYKQGKVAEAKEMLQASDILTDRKGFKQIRIPPHVQAAFDKLP